MAEEGFYRIQRIEIYPQIDREIACTKVPDRIIRHLHELIRAVEAKSLGDDSWYKRRSVFQRSIVAALNVVCVTIARPPGKHIWRRWRALAFAEGAGSDDRLDLRQSAIEDFNFVDPTSS